MSVHKRYEPRFYKSHGTGEFLIEQFKKIGKKVIFERGVLVFHPENISIGSNVYIGHNAILKGYYKNEMKIGSNTWIGQGCFLHSGGGIEIGEFAGIGPFVKILTHQHCEEAPNKPLILCKQKYEKVMIGDGCDIGIGAIILPGVTIGKNSIVGAGAVVVKDVAPYSVVAGSPARLIRMRDNIK